MSSSINAGKQVTPKLKKPIKMFENREPKKNTQRKKIKKLRAKVRELEDDLQREKQRTANERIERSVLEGRIEEMTNVLKVFNDVVRNKFREATK